MRYVLQGVVGVSQVENGDYRQREQHVQGHGLCANAGLFGLAGAQVCGWEVRGGRGGGGGRPEKRGGEGERCGEGTKEPGLQRVLPP